MTVGEARPKGPHADSHCRKRAHVGLARPKNEDRILAMTLKIGCRKLAIDWSDSMRQNYLFRNSVKRPHIGLKWPGNEDRILVMTPKI